MSCSQQKRLWCVGRPCQSGLWTELANGLRSPNYVFSNATPARFSTRIASQLVGLGLLDAVAKSTIMAWADPDDEDSDGISGRAATGTELTTLTTECDQAFLVTDFTAHAQKTVFLPAPNQVAFEFPLNVVRQCLTFSGQFLPELRVVLRCQLIEERLLGPMALISESTGVHWHSLP